MTPDEITDEKSLKAWLEGQTREVALTIAHRAVMRAAPVVWKVVRPTSLKVDLSALVNARLLLVTGLAGVGRLPTTDGIEQAARSADDASYIVRAIAFPGRDAAFKALEAAELAGAAVVSGHTRSHAASAVDSIAEGYANSLAQQQDGMWKCVKNDAAALNGQKTGQVAAATRLWSAPTDTYDIYWRPVREAWAATDDPGWQFWIDWYEKALVGQPLLGDWARHWALLTDIALIPDADWKAGPDRVNSLIAEIVEKHESTGEPRPPVQTILNAAQQNRDALLVQLDALSELVEKGAQDVRGWNVSDELEQAERERQLLLFARLRQAVDELRRLLSEPGALTTQSAEEMATWAQVIAQTGKEWNNAGKAYVRRDAGPRLDLTARVILGGSVAGVLTAIGLPTVGAAAGSTIIGSKMIEGVVRGLKGGSGS